MVPTTSTANLNIGFLTVLHEANGYVGGYLVTNQWGRPLEFRLSTAVQPNRVQQILYGGTLQPYVCAELIGKTLVDKTGVSVQIVVTDTQDVLDLRRRLEVPVIWLTPPGVGRISNPSGEVGRISNPSYAGGDPADPEKLPGFCAQRSGQGPVFCHPAYPQDIAPVRDLLERLDGSLELGEPFVRIREAVGEARKMGVTGRLTG